MVDGLSRSGTLYTAGALAQAYNTSLLQEYAPEKCAQYLAAATLAWSAFAAHGSDDSYWKDDASDLYRNGAHVWSDELLVAAANLLEATGDPSYASAITQELPADMTRAMMRWTWVTDGPWVNAWVALSRSTSPYVSEIAQYQWALFNLGDTVHGWTEAPPGLPSADIQDGNMAWYFNDPWNAARVNAKFPALSTSYPYLYRYSDAWNRGADIGFDQAARGAASLLPLVATGVSVGP